MFLILPVLGGLLLGWKAPLRIAIAVQVVLAAVAATILIATAPDHGHSYSIGFLVVPGVAVISALTLWVGTQIAGRHRAAN